MAMKALRHKRPIVQDLLAPVSISRRERGQCRDAQREGAASQRSEDTMICDGTRPAHRAGALLAAESRRAPVAGRPLPDREGRARGQTGWRQLPRRLVSRLLTREQKGGSVLHGSATLGEMRC